VCIQDYRLVRNVRQVYATAAINAGDTAAVLNPAAGRLMVVFAFADPGAVGDDLQLHLGPVVNGAIYPLATINVYRPSVVLSIFDAGGVLLQGLSVSNVGAGAATYRIIDQILDGDAEQVVNDPH